MLYVVPALLFWELLQHCRTNKHCRPSEWLQQFYSLRCSLLSHTSSVLAAVPVFTAECICREIRRLTLCLPAPPGPGQAVVFAGETPGQSESPPPPPPPPPPSARRWAAAQWGAGLLPCCLCCHWWWCRWCWHWEWWSQSPLLTGPQCWLELSLASPVCQPVSAQSVLQTLKGPAGPGTAENTALTADCRLKTSQSQQLWVQFTQSANFRQLIINN